MLTINITNNTYSVEQLQEYQKLISELKETTSKWSLHYGQHVLKELEKLNYSHDIIRPIVFNTDLERNPQDIRHILVVDNPGEEEQVAGQYLVGSAGKTAKYFHEKLLLLDNFRDRVLVLNKTPIHTKATGDLKKLRLPSGFLKETQQVMARATVRLAKLLQCPLWILGIQELRNGGIFSSFAMTVKMEIGEDLERLRVYKHFSYGKFLQDLRKGESYDLSELDPVGRKLRERYFS